MSRSARPRQPVGLVLHAATQRLNIGNVQTPARVFGARDDPSAAHNVTIHTPVSPAASFGLEGAGARRQTSRAGRPSRQTEISVKKTAPARCSIGQGPRQPCPGRWRTWRGEFTHRLGQKKPRALEGRGAASAVHAAGGAGSPVEEHARTQNLDREERERQGPRRRRTWDARLPYRRLTKIHSYLHNSQGRWRRRDFSHIRNVSRAFSFFDTPTLKSVGFHCSTGFPQPRVNRPV
jgi:hypothetical protein